METSTYNVKSDGVDLYVKSICEDLACGDSDKTDHCKLLHLQFPDSGSSMHVVNCKGETLTSTSMLKAGEQIELICKDEFNEGGDEKSKQQTGKDRTVTECQDNGHLSVDWSVGHLSKNNHLKCGKTSANSLMCGTGSAPVCSMSGFTMPSSSLNMVIKDCNNDILGTDSTLKSGQQIQLTCKEGYGQGGHGNGTIVACGEKGDIGAYNYQTLTVDAITCSSLAESVETILEKTKSGNETSSLFEGFAAASSTSANSWFGQFVVLAVGCAVAAVAFTAYKQRSQQRVDATRQELATLMPNEA